MIENATEDQIRERIEHFVKELDLLVRRSALEALQGVLGEARAGARTGPRAVGKRPGRKPRGGSPAGAEAVLAELQAHPGPGRSISELGAAVGGSRPQLRKLLQDLASEGRVETTGQRRGMRYHLKGTARAGVRPARKPAARKGKARKAKARKA